MKNLRVIEELIRSKANKGYIDVDTDKLWSQIEDDLPEEKKRRFLPFWFIGGVVLLTLVALSLNKELVVGNTSNDIAENEQESSRQELQNPELNSIIERHRKPTSKINHPNDKLNKNNAIGKNNRSNSNSIIKSNEQQGIRSLDDFVGSKEALTLVDKSINKDGKVTQTTQALVVPSDAISTVYGVDFLGSLGLLNLTSDAKYNPNPPVRQYMPWERKEEKWIVGISGGYSNSLTSFSLRNTDFVDHFNNRKAAERSLASWHLSGNLSFVFNRHWSIRGGLRYNNIYRRSSATVSSSEIVTIDDAIIERIIGPNGTEEVRGTVDVLQETVSELSRINSYKSLDVELMLLRNIDMAVLEGYVGIGLSQGISMSQRGYIHPTISEEYDLKRDTNGWYKSQRGLGAVLEMGLSYPVGEKLSLSLYGVYKQPFSEVTTATYSLKERRSTYNIGLGINYKL